MSNKLEKINNYTYNLKKFMNFMSINDVHYHINHIMILAMKELEHNLTFYNLCVSQFKTNIDIHEMLEIIELTIESEYNDEISKYINCHDNIDKYKIIDIPKYKNYVDYEYIYLTLKNYYDTFTIPTKLFFLILNGDINNDIIFCFKYHIDEMYYNTKNVKLFEIEKNNYINIYGGHYNNIPHIYFTNNYFKSFVATFKYENYFNVSIIFNYYPTITDLIKFNYLNIYCTLKLLISEIIKNYDICSITRTDLYIIFLKIQNFNCFMNNYTITKFIFPLFQSWIKNKSKEEILYTKNINNITSNYIKDVKILKIDKENFYIYSKIII